MTNAMDEVQVPSRWMQDRFHRGAAILGTIVVALTVGLLAMSQLQRPSVDASAVTADSYRQFAEAMELVPVVTPAAVTAESYLQYADAMRLIRSR